MERTIVKFVEALREGGIRVSPSESLDAVQAASLCGMTNRRTTRRLLRLTLVKNLNDIQVFNEIFNQFFSRFPPESEMDLPGVMDAAIVTMEGEFTCYDQCESHDDDHGPLLKLDSVIKPEDLQDLQSLQEIDPEDSDGNEIVVQIKGYRGKAQGPRPTRRYTQNPLTIELNKDQNDLLGRRVTFTAEEQAAMQDVVSRMMTRLRKDTRRMKHDQRRGKLHVIRTIRKNYRNDMVPFQIALRRKRPEKPRLVVLCDVSYSVSHAARFMMLLLHTLQNQHLSVRSFIFNRELAEITELLANMPVNDLMETIDRGDIVDLDENSSFGQVFLSFKKRFMDNLRGRPAFIFLGDARNNYDEANDWVLEQIREKARYMLWLTPEDRELWSRGDCLIETYGSYCDKVEVVKTVDDLSFVVEDLLRDIYADQAHPLERKQIRDAKAAEEVDYRDYYNRGATVVKTPSFDPAGRKW